MPRKPRKPKAVLRPIDRHWIERYLVHMNGLRAAREAYEAFDRRVTHAAVHDYSATMMAHPACAAAIAQRVTTVAMEADEVLARHAEIARGDIDDCLDDDGELDLEKARDRGVTHLIKSVTVKRVPMRSGDEMVERKIELYPADAAQRTIMKHLGLLTDIALRRYLPKTGRELDEHLVTEIARVKGVPVQTARDLYSLMLQSKES